ncbi:MAG: hypothetical protein CM15mP111_4360 [Hyphomicrobiales bacterium]|nr:MAG: hypothetical protein CM15mP111_4360 [Hyphomicrobiales bacterium]
MSNASVNYNGTGVYGEPLPKQNGAPLRLIVPWKYGFKSIKSITKISFKGKEPVSSWNQQNQQNMVFIPKSEPNRASPRWSQASERYIGGGKGKISWKFIHKKI